MSDIYFEFYDAVTPEEFENINISASDQKIIEWFK